MLTDKEFTAMTNLVFCDYQDLGPGEGNGFANVVGHPVWDWCATGKLGKNAGGIVASLSRKGYVRCQGSGDDATTAITEEGRQVWLAARKLRSLPID